MSSLINPIPTFLMMFRVSHIIELFVYPKVNETINQIEEAFLDNLMEKDWLDNVTKDRCMDKVNTWLHQII